MIIMSVKYGTLVWHIFICPGIWQEWQGTSNETGSYFKNYFYSNGLVKFILFPIFFSSSCFIYYWAFYTLYPIAVSSSTVLGILVTCKFLSAFGAYGFFINELPLGSIIFMVIGNLDPLEYSLSFSTNVVIC